MFVCCPQLFCVHIRVRRSKLSQWLLIHSPWPTFLLRATGPSLRARFPQALIVSRVIRRWPPAARPWRKNLCLLGVVIAVAIVIVLLAAQLSLSLWIPCASSESKFGFVLFEFGKFFIQWFLKVDCVARLESNPNPSSS